MARPARLPRNLRAGTALLLLLAAVALAAPLLATDQPWLARGPHGLVSPAIGSLLGRRPATRTGETTLLRAPIPYAPGRVDLEEVLESPSASHWLGTDGLGRDVHGGRVSLTVGLLAALTALCVGLPLGAAAGYRGGWTDAAISRIVEAVLCFPALLLALVVLAMSPGWLATFPRRRRNSYPNPGICWSRPGTTPTTPCA